MGTCQSKKNTYQPQATPQISAEQQRQNEQINQVMKDELMPALQQLVASFGPALEKAKEVQKEKGMSQKDLDHLDKIQKEAVPHMEKQLALVAKQIGEENPEKHDAERLELEKETEKVKEALKRD